MNKGSIHRTLAVIGIVTLTMCTGRSIANPTYSQNGDATNCRACHGDFRASSYFSLSDGQNWGNLHNLHRNVMLSGDCNTCHGSSGKFPVRINSSAGGAGFAPIGCVGCHGRSEDANPGAGLRQHHWNSGITLCAGCHFDANPANFTPVGEGVPPPYYFTPDPNHPNKPTDPCNPNGGENFAGAAEGSDNDGDGLYDANDPDCIVCVDNDMDGVTDCDGDCDDNDPTVFPGAPELCDGIDNDCDGVIPPNEVDNDGDGFAACQGDCDDTNATVFPGASELCDGLDNDCDGVIPPNEVDNDGDGIAACAGDCDDANATVFPGAPELCDGVDNDCDGVVPPNETDADGDGFAACAGDCDDTNATVFPGAPELCDGIDNDCDGQIDEDPSCACLDNDLDGVTDCDGDCNDNDPTVFPGAPELCDGVDNDCDGVIPPNEVDNDGDGVAACAGDCDDANAAVFPGAPELCDGIDNDCDGVIPPNEIDSDGDGFAACQGDCDDTNATVFPGAPELCDGLDNDCDGAIDEGACGSATVIIEKFKVPKKVKIRAGSTKTKKIDVALELDAPMGTVAGATVELFRDGALEQSASVEITAGDGRDRVTFYVDITEGDAPKVYWSILVTAQGADPVSAMGTTKVVVHEGDDDGGDDGDDDDHDGDDHDGDNHHGDDHGEHDGDGHHRDMGVVVRGDGAGGAALSVQTGEVDSSSIEPLSPLTTAAQLDELTASSRNCGVALLPTALTLSIGLVGRMAQRPRRRKRTALRAR